MNWLVIRKDGTLKCFTETKYLIEYIAKYEDEIQSIQAIVGRVRG